MVQQNGKPGLRNQVNDLNNSAQTCDPFALIVFFLLKYKKNDNISQVSIAEITSWTNKKAFLYNTVRQELMTLVNHTLIPLLTRENLAARWRLDLIAWNRAFPLRCCGKVQ